MAPISFKRGAVFKVKYHPPDDHSKELPKYVVCLQEGEIPTNSHFFTAVVITSKKPGKPRVYRWEVEIDPTGSDLQTPYPDLNQPSKILCAQIHTIYEADIITPASQLSEQKLKEVDGKVLLYGIGQRPL